MRKPISRRSRASGFTLLETIIAIVITSIFATLIIAMTGSLVTDSPETVTMVEDEFEIIQELEQLISKYRYMVDHDMSNVLATIYADAQASSYVKSNQTGYITFTGTTGSAPSATPSPYLVVTLTKNKQTVTKMFTE